MKTPLRSALSILLLFGFLTAAPPAISSETIPIEPFDLVLLMTDVAQTLDLVDGFAAEVSQTQGPPLTAMVRGMLQGTDWLDPDRAIVAGITLNAGGAPTLLVYIPYVTPKDSFAQAVGGVTGDGFYCFSLPPGAPPPLSDPGVVLLQSLANEKRAGDTLRLILPVERLIQDNRETVDGLLAGLEKRTQANPGPNPLLQPEDLKMALSAMVETAGQMELLSLSMGIDKERFTTRMDAAAREKSRLYDLFSSTSRTARLENYQPEYPITFRCRGYDMQALFNLLGDSFGTLYEKVGVDFNGLKVIAGELSGEMAGGVRYGEKGPVVELVAVLKQADSSGQFLEKHYLPWLMASGERMQQKLGNASGPIYEQTADSEVLGHRVVGVRTRIPIMPLASEGSKAVAPMSSVVYELRMTSVGDLLLAASDDQRLQTLLQQAATFEEAPDPGHLMNIELDLAEYLKGLSRYLPEGADLPVTPPSGVTVRYHVDFEKGKAHLQSTVGLKGLKEIIAYAGAVSAAVETAAAGTTEASPGAQAPTMDTGSPPSASPAATPQENPEDTAQYWFERGALCAAYGEDRAAIRNYRRALALDPENAHYRFQLGVSLGESGDYPAAIEAMNEALKREEAPRFLYGRGRVHLLAGDREAALSDFRKAAALGHREAQRYLQQNAF